MSLWPFHKPEPVHIQPRFHAATREESAKVRAAKASVELQLGCYVANTPLEERQADTDAYFAVASALSAPTVRRRVA